MVGRRVSVDVDALGQRVERLAGLPVVNQVLDRLGFDAAVAAALGAPDPRWTVDPAAAIGVLVRNLCLGRQPLYSIAAWAAGFDPAALRLSPEQVGALTDDALGAALDRLFDADRASLLTAQSLATIRAFGVSTAELHNDSTSLTLFGAYRHTPDPVDPPRPAARPERGFSKDHRPDLLQLVQILTVAVETDTGRTSAVPITCRLADGNTEDSTTHVSTWQQCRTLAGRADFLYVADSKLATRDNMEFIDGEGGRFCSVLPASRAEVGAGRDWIATRGPAWSEIARRPGRRRADPDDVYWATPAPTPSAEGFRIVWIRSSAKRARDAAARCDRIERATAALDTLAAQLASPRCRITTRHAAEDAARRAIADAGGWLHATIGEQIHVEHKQERRGRPGPNTRYRRVERHRFTLTHTIDSQRVAHDAAADGCFPIISNDTTMTERELLAAYKNQPHLERDNHVFKTVIEATPVLLKNTERIDAFSFCWYTALLVHALIERQLRRAIDTAGIQALPLYPEQRACTSPTASRVLELLEPLTRTHITHAGQTLTVIPAQPNPVQAQLLDLLEVPASGYQATSQRP